MNDIFLAFVPMFFAMDPLGILPIFVGLTQGMDAAVKKRIISQSLITAFLVAIGFIFVGKAIFAFLGIGMGDFMMAGGAILFCLSIRELLNAHPTKVHLDEDLGAVPLGTPLIVGPAVLTMALMSVSQHGLWPTIVAVILNLLLVAFVFIFSGTLIRCLGSSGARAVSKVLSLLLAAIGVMLIRKGFLMSQGL